MNSAAGKGSLLGAALYRAVLARALHSTAPMKPSRWRSPFWRFLSRSHFQDRGALAFDNHWTGITGDEVRDKVAERGDQYE